MSNTFYARSGKRWLDVVCSSFGLLLLSPLFAAAAIAVKVSSKGPVFFRQVRTGRNSISFRIFKFRSMRVLQPTGASLLTASGDSRITSVGRWLRKSKIDELPQLINVFLGDMSLVGPRPEVPKYTGLYSAEQQEVLAVRPGITSPTAIAFVDEEALLAAQPDPEAYYVKVLLPEKLQLDLAYCRNISFRADLAFILQTFLRIGTRQSNPAAGMPRLSKSSQETV